MFLVMLLLTAPIHVALGLTWLLAAAQLPLAAAGVTLYALTVYTLLLAAAGRLFPRQEEKLLIEVVEGR
jgi:hypothetical protein